MSIYSQFDSFFNDFVPNYVHPIARNGYVPHFLLIYCYCPLLYHKYPNDIMKIIDEIHIDRTEFDVSPSVAEDIITRKNPFIADTEFQKSLVGWYLEFVDKLKDIQSLPLNPFCSATLEVFPNKDHTGGHAITLLYGTSNLKPDKPGFFIIDDHNTISKFHDYYNKHNERLYEISIRDVDDTMITLLNKCLHDKCSIDKHCKFSSRVTRYVLCLEQNFLIPDDEILKPELRTEKINTIKLTSNNDSNNIIPSISNSIVNPIPIPAQPNYKTKNIYEILLIGVAIGTIIGIIISIIYINYRNNDTVNIVPFFNKKQIK